jgi:hypothetical protein
MTLDALLVLGSFFTAAVFLVDDLVAAVLPDELLAQFLFVQFPSILIDPQVQNSAKYITPSMMYIHFSLVLSLDQNFL